MSYDVYVGPYLKAETRIIKVPTLKLTCSNFECKAHGQYHGPFNPDKFCSKCGSIIKEIPFYDERPEVFKFEVSENIKERMFCALEDENESPTIYHYWLSNTGDFKKTINREVCVENEEKETEITEHMIYSESKVFQELYAKDIKKIKNSGYINVEIHWGVISYYI